MQLRRQRRSAPRAAPLPETARSAGEDFGRAEIHSHTRASDGMVSAEELVRAAADAELSVLCITDHDTLPELGAAIELGSQLGVDVVRGEEVTAAFPRGVHLLALFIERPVRMHMSPVDTVDAIHDQGGLAVIAHPFMPTWFASMSPRGARALLEERAVDGIELRHTAPVLPRTWARLDAFYAAHRERAGAALGSSDSHFGAHDVGRVITAFPGRSAADLRRAIVERSTSPLTRPGARGPTLRMRVEQQYRSLVWLPLERLSGRVGRGPAQQR